MGLKARCLVGVVSSIVVESGSRLHVLTSALKGGYGCVVGRVAVDAGGDVVLRHGGCCEGPVFRVCLRKSGGHSDGELPGETCGAQNHGPPWSYL
jgi:hypothetical protein